MGNIIYVTLAGFSKIAIANSIYFTVTEFIKKSSVEQFEKLLILVVKSNTSPIKKGDINSLIFKYFNLSKDLSLEIEFLDEMIIPEHKLIDIFKKIQSELTPFLDNNTNNQIIVDLTAGRKIMSIGLTLSIIEYWKKNRNINLFVSYYLLKKFYYNKEKTALELFSDEFSVEIWPMQELEVIFNE